MCYPRIFGKLWRRGGPWEVEEETPKVPGVSGAVHILWNRRGRVKWPQRDGKGSLHLMWTPCKTFHPKHLRTSLGASDTKELAVLGHKGTDVQRKRFPTWCWDPEGNRCCDVCFPALTPARPSPSAVPSGGWYRPAQGTATFGPSCFLLAVLLHCSVTEGGSQESLRILDITCPENQSWNQNRTAPEPGRSDLGDMAAPCGSPLN